MESNEQIECEFKTPNIVSVDELKTETKNKQTVKHQNSGSNVDNESKTVLPEPLTKLMPPNDHYFVDQLKNGVIVDHKILTKSRVVFGRATDCDVVLEHPSISRYHAILLWTPSNEDDYQNGKNSESFWYLIDCGSTHGSNCNKQPITAGKMIKLVPNNNVFKLGASTRFFSLGSNVDIDEDNDEELEDNNSHQKIKLKKEDNEYNGCSWGINDDEEEETNEESDDSKSLQAIIAAMKTTTSDALKTDNDNVYNSNPNKCIQQWFEREGYDVEFKVDSIHNKFKCTLELPIDGQWIPVEGSLLHKKKEAISDACLKSCQLLDRAELLFPWQQQKEKALRRKHNKDMDSDDDMIDETVKISKKKHRRESDSNESSVDNFQTLNKKWSQINEELRQLRVKLATIGAQIEPKPEMGQQFDDSLDDYMASIGKRKYGLSISDKIEKSNIKMKINVLEKEQKKVEKLIQLTKPLDLADKCSKSEQTLSTGISETKDTGDTNVKVPVIPTKHDSKLDEKKVFGNVERDRTQEIAVKTEAIISEIKSFKQKSKLDSKSMQKIRAQSIVETIEKEKQLEKNKLKTRFETDNDYVDWLPPVNQSGDGKTNLNKKFGY